MDKAENAFKWGCYFAQAVWFMRKDLIYQVLIGLKFTLLNPFAIATEVNIPTLGITIN